MQMSAEAWPLSAGHAPVAHSPDALALRDALADRHLYHPAVRVPTGPELENNLNPPLP